jgi:uncharacterized membrane protein
MKLSRLMRHLAASFWPRHHFFKSETLRMIETEISAAEKSHGGEIRFVVERHLTLGQLWHNLSARQRAVQLFSLLGVWDTAANNGVLIYVLLADRSVEFLADRGISAKVPAEEWGGLCRQVEHLFGAGDYTEGARVAIRGVAQHLGAHFPVGAPHSHELPNQAVLL